MIRILIAVVVALGMGNWWQSHVISNLKMEHANERIARDRANRVDAERRIATHRAADVQAQSRLHTVDTDRVQLDDVGSGLRLITATVRSTADDPAACHANAAALSDVFDDCQAAYGDMAETADRWTVEAVKQNQAAQ